MVKYFLKNWSFLLVATIFVFGLFFASQIIWAWQAPTATPPNNNIPTPVNQGTDDQDKTGSLTLRDTPSALNISNGSAISLFPTDSLVQSIKLKAPNTGLTGYTLTFPNNVGAANQYLKTDGTGNLSWSSVTSGATNAIWDADNDTGVQTEESSDEDKIRFDTTGSERMVIDSAGNVGVNTGTSALTAKTEIRHTSMNSFLKFTLSTNTSRYADLSLDSDGNVFNTAYGPAYILRTSGGAKNFIIYVDPSTGNPDFSASGSAFTYSDNIQMGTPTTPRKEIRFTDNTGSNYVGLRAPTSVSSSLTWLLPAADGTSGQTLTTDGAGNLSWSSGGADNDWTINGSYMTTGYNARVGTGGTVDYANGAGDLYVQDNLEVDGTSYFANLLPSVSNTYNLGSSTNQWNNIFAKESNSLVLKLPNTGYDAANPYVYDRGIIYFGDEPFIHNGGSAIGYTNTYVGKSAGSFPQNTTDNALSINNTAVGYHALQSNTQGYRNAAVGSSALTLNTTGKYNAAYGDGSLANVSTASYNAAYGYYSLNTYTGSVGYNTALGGLAMRYNLSGNYNVAVGFQALRGPNTGTRNAYENVAVGYNAGYSADTGYRNVYMGSGAGYSNQTGSENVFVGSRAGYNNLTGNGNIFIGIKAGYDELGSNKLYINNGQLNKDQSLIYGEFYNGSVTDSLLRVNGKLGVSLPGQSFTPSSLLHVYDITSGHPNAEIDIQSSLSSDFGYWGIYQDRGFGDLRFWSNFIDDSDHKNLLTLSPGNTSSHEGRVGIGTGATSYTRIPTSKLQVHDKENEGTVLTISNFDEDNVGNASGNFRGTAQLDFVAGYDPSNYSFRSAANIIAGFFAGDALANAGIKIQTYGSGGSLEPTIMARNDSVGIGGDDIETGKKLRVWGSTRSEGYFSTTNYEGADATGNGVCIWGSGPSGATQVELFFEDGLFLCASANASNVCSTCTLAYCLSGNSNCGF